MQKTQKGRKCTKYTTKQKVDKTTQQNRKWKKTYSKTGSAQNTKEKEKVYKTPQNRKCTEHTIKKKVHKTHKKP